MNKSLNKVIEYFKDQNSTDKKKPNKINSRMFSIRVNQTCKQKEKQKIESTLSDSSLVFSACDSAPMELQQLYYFMAT